ncbi:MAG TPA: dethiobiotin synthase [Candidatus Angelobacter sp.]|jgi:dethiobiotin synthase|nr:dethiobiotin synthase [Candidatus Angelobacter sp.]
MREGFFVTGTDTNVGKTVLSALLCAGLPGVYWKPIQTGSRHGTDRQTVISWTELTEDELPPEVYVFEDAVSPHLAAQRAGAEITLERIKIPAVPKRVSLIVEGAGGVMVPINTHQFMTDVMRHLALPVVLAARSTLGTINHTLLSASCLREAGVTLQGVVLIGPPNPENKHAIERYGNVPVIGEIPRLKTINKDTLRQVFARHFVREAFT